MEDTSTTYGRTIYRVKFGSHLYGTTTPASDEDWKEVYIPPVRDIILQRTRDVIRTGRTKDFGERNTNEDVDTEAYALHRYLELLVQGQTVAIDMLFATGPCVVHTTHIWRLIYENRNRLLTKRSAAFVGYCRQQANKYGIKGSRVDAAKKAVEYWESVMEEYGSQVKVGEYISMAPTGEHIEITEKETTPGTTEHYFVCCDRMVGFKNTVKEAASIYRRVYNSYGDRALRAQSNEGIDWKALSHAVRVGYEAKELLLTGNVTFPRPEAVHLLEVKQGVLPYTVVAEEIERLLIEVEEASTTSTLRDEADKTWIDDFVESVYLTEVLHG